MGRRRLEEGDVEGARALLAPLAQRRPGFADLQYLLGLVHERSGDLDAAVACLERALAINFAYAEARLALLSVLERRGEFGRARDVAEDGALAAAGRAREGLDPVTQAKLANLQAAMGDAYREAGQLPDAVEAYRKALARAPRFHDVRIRLAVALRESGLPDQALREIDRVLRVAPDQLDAAVQRGLTLFTLGRAAQAREVWSHVLRRDPERDDARMYLRLVRPPE